MSHLRQTEGRTKKGKSIFLNTTKKLLCDDPMAVVFVFFFLNLYTTKPAFLYVITLFHNVIFISAPAQTLSLTLFSQPLPNSQIDLYKHQMQ